MTDIQYPDTTTDHDFSPSEPDPLEMLRGRLATLPKKGRPPGIPGTVNRVIEYKCSCCHKEVGREHLFIREVTFKRLDNPIGRARTRRDGWICDVCILNDRVYNLPRARSGRRSA